MLLCWPRISRRHHELALRGSCSTICWRGPQTKRSCGECNICLSSGHRAGPSRGLFVVCMFCGASLPKEGCGQSRRCNLSATRGWGEEILHPTPSTGDPASTRAGRPRPFPPLAPHGAPRRSRTCIPGRGGHDGALRHLLRLFQHILYTAEALARPTPNAACWCLLHRAPYGRSATDTFVGWGVARNGR